MLRTLTARLLRQSACHIRIKKIRHPDRLFSLLRETRAKLDSDRDPETSDFAPKIGFRNKFGLTHSNPSPRIILQQLLANEREVPEKSASIFHFAYIPTEQEENVANLVDLVLKKTIDVAANIIDKRAVHGAVFYGMAGSGKSRMAIELLDMMRHAVKKNQHPKARDLANLLSNPKKLVIDWQNGLAYADSIEKDWSPALILGSRVAAKYWFKNYDFSVIRNMIRRMPAEDREQFDYEYVIAAIERENSAKPPHEQHSMLYIANDEFQKLKSVKKSLYNLGESLSRAIAREFAVVSRNYHQRLFIFGCFVGIGFSQADIFENPTVGVYPDYCIRRLSIKSAKQLVVKELGENYAQIQELPRLLATLGGNPRVLEIFVKEVAPTLDIFDLEKAFNRTLRAILDRYGMTFTEGPLRWPMYLSLAGYSIDARSDIVAWPCNSEVNAIIPWSAAQVEQTGFVSLRAPTLGEAWAQDFSSMVFDVPLIMAKMINANFAQPLYVRGIELPAIVKVELFEQCNAITRSFFTDCYLFENLALKQLVLRWNIFNLSSSTFVYARQLFHGAYFTDNFAKHRFALESQLFSVPATKLQGDWATTPEQATYEITTMAGQLSLLSPKVQSLHLGGKNVFDGFFKVLDAQTNEPIMIWIDTKHSAQRAGPGYLSPTEVTDLRTKLEVLTTRLSKFKHLLVVITNRKYLHKASLLNDNMCIIARDGLSFATSPWFSLAAQVDVEAETNGESK